MQDHLKTRVSILNTGVLGYSPEQYYFSLIALANRFHPQFVVVSVVANDFGNFADVETRGVGDWNEGKYWLAKIADYCQSHHWPALIVPAPSKGSIVGRRFPGYLGPLLKIFHVDSLSVLDPTDDFVNAHLKLQAKARQKGQTLQECLLFNNSIDDDHFSAAGSEVWAASVGERVMLLLPEGFSASTRSENQALPRGRSPS